MIGSHPSLLRVLDVADTVAPSDATILVLGESGTGKELLAQRIHEKSGRKGPFVAVNCAALPRDLFESELFGHERGAFTGALCKRPGKFELANKGTLLLDEISEIDPQMQAKLLRVLQEQEITRLGGSYPIPIDVRVIATSNRNLADEVAAGRFRADLYYRLRVVPLHLPALRQRMTDVPELAAHFVAKFGGAGVSNAAMVVLMSHRWPGNVRELEHVIQRGVLLSKGTRLQPQDVSFEDESGEQPGAPYVDHLVGIPVHQVERMLLRATLERTDGNQLRAAELLGVSRRTIFSWLKDMETGSVPVVVEE